MSENWNEDLKQPSALRDVPNTTTTSPASPQSAQLGVCDQTTGKVPHPRIASGAGACINWRPIQSDQPAQGEPTATQKMRDRPVTHAEALYAASRLITSFFGNSGDKARASIPVRADDDDVLILDYISEQAAPASQPSAPAQKPHLDGITPEFQPSPASVDAREWAETCARQCLMILKEHYGEWVAFQVGYEEIVPVIATLLESFRNKPVVISAPASCDREAGRLGDEQ